MDDKNIVNLGSRGGEVIRTAAFNERCKHNKFIVDDSLNTVTCAICKKDLNPMWVLLQLAGRENRAFQQLEVLKLEAEKAKAKNSCKCEHCHKMTRIHRPR